MAMKGVAELSGRLLARKGEAAPAAHEKADASQSVSPVRRRPPQSFGNRRPQSADQETRRGAGTTAPSAAPRSGAQLAAPLQRRVKFTLRLDPDHHTMLKRLCAETGRSGQSLLMEALDTCLAAYGHEEIDCAWSSQGADGRAGTRTDGNET